MKFVVNRVHEDSVWTEAETQGREVVVKSISKTTRGNGLIYGDHLRGGITQYTINGFTIAEIDDEGYLL